MARRTYPLIVLRAQRAFAIRVGATDAPPDPAHADDAKGRAAVAAWLARLYEPQVTPPSVRRRVGPGMCYLSSPLPQASAENAPVLWARVESSVLRGKFKLCIGVTDVPASLADALDTPGMWPTGSLCPLYKRWKEYHHRYGGTAIVALAVADTRVDAEACETALAALAYAQHERVVDTATGVVKDQRDRKGALSKAPVCGAVVYVALAEEEGARAYHTLRKRGQSLEKNAKGGVL